ncbi:hypothetical protein AgCh_021855 [Apium graveolens]
MHSKEYLRSRSILTPTNVLVDDNNAHILKIVPGNVHTYLNQDSIEDSGVDDNDFDASFPVEYLNSLNMPCLPKHELKVKVGAVVMLMRNLNPIMGLVKDEAKKYGPKENLEFAIDIIGVVEDFIKVSKIPTKFGDRDIVRFKICDAWVGIWGDMAKVVSDQYEEYNHEENVIVILTSAKLGIYNDTLQINNLTSSKVYINLDDECVLEMRNRLELEGYKPSRDDVDNSYALTLVSPYEFINLKKLIDNIAGSVEVNSNFTAMLEHYL